MVFYYIIINMKKKIIDNYHELATYFVWAVAWVSVFGSLYFSEIKEFVPCDLCWWQRLFVYPLAILATVAIIRKDFSNFMYYVLPFGVIGLVVSFYHSLLQWGIIEKNILNCSATGVSCSKPEIEIFGFITIPFLSFLAFMALTIVSGLGVYKAKLDANQSR